MTSVLHSSVEDATLGERRFWGLDNPGAGYVASIVFINVFTRESTSVGNRFNRKD